MALVLADRVRETTTTTGTGSVILGGAYTGFQTFSAGIGNGNTTYYTIANVTTGEWEVGLGTYSSGSNSLARTTIFSSSNGNAAVNFTTGTKDVFVTQPAERAVFVDSNNVAAANSATIPNTLLANSAITINGNSVSLGGSTTVTANTTNSLTFNDAGSGATTGTVFNGSTAYTISYNTIGASPVAGSSFITTVGTVTSGTWNASTIVTTYGGTGLTSYTAGDMTYYATGTALTKLAIGTSNAVLTSNGSAPQWTATLPIASGGTGLTTFTAGDLPYYAAGTALSRLGIGTSKTILTSSGTAPQWSVSLDTSQGGTGVTTYTAGDLTYYATGTALSKLGIGANNAVLTSTGSAPQWTATLPIASGGTGLSSVGAAGTALVSTGSAAAWTVQYLSISFIIDTGGSVVIPTGIKGDLTVPFACTITEWTLLADQSGSIVVDIWKDTYANYPPTVADTITGSALPTITSAVKGQSSTLTGWTATIAAGDTLRFNVNSATTITRVTLSLKVYRT